MSENSVSGLVMKVLAASETKQEAVRRLLDGESAAAPTTTNKQLFVTIKDAAEICGFCRKTIYNLISRDRLRLVEIKPGMRRIRTADLEKFVATAEVAR